MAKDTFKMFNMGKKYTVKVSTCSGFCVEVKTGSLLKKTETWTSLIPHHNHSHWHLNSFHVLTQAQFAHVRHHHTSDYNNLK